MGKSIFIQFILVISILIFCSSPLKAQRNEFENEMDSLINVLPKQKEDSIKAMNLMQIATYKLGEAQRNGKWNEGIEWAHKALKLSTKVNYMFGLGRCNWILAHAWFQKGNYPESIKYYSDAIKASIRNGRRILAVISYTEIGNCYSALGNYQETLKNYQLGLETLARMNYTEDSQERAMQEFLTMGTGNVYAKLHNYSEALDWYAKLLNTNKTVEKLDILTSMALVQIEMKNYDEALNNLLAALPLLSKKLIEKPETDYKGVLGTQYLKIGDVYCKIASIKTGTESTHLYKEAVAYLEKALPLLTEGAGGKETLMNTYALLKEASEATNDYQNALHFTKLYNQLRDSIYNKTTYLKLAAQQVKYETEKATADLKGKQEKERIEQNALRYKLLADQKLEEEKKRSDEKIMYERSMANEKSNSEKSIANEKLNAVKSIASEKSRQEKLRAEKQLVNNILLMGLLLVIMTSVFLILYLRQRTAKRRAIEKAETIHKMAELELQSLRSQLNPHFMFNSLNSIQELILLEENDKSHVYLSRFSKLLRMLLENAEKPFIPLQKEIDFLQLYLDLENLRVPDLQYSISTDPGLNTTETLIPNLILQPYIENAIWHGLAHKVVDKQLKIRIYQENGTVNYEIEDNGVGRKKSSELKSLFRRKHISKGMELLTKRFKLLNEEYRTNIIVSISDVIKNNDVSGTLVSIKLPVNFPGYLQN